MITDQIRSAVYLIDPIPEPERPRWGVMHANAQGAADRRSWCAGPSGNGEVHIARYVPLASLQDYGTGCSTVWDGYSEFLLRVNPKCSRVGACESHAGH